MSFAPSNTIQDDNFYLGNMNSKYSFSHLQYPQNIGDRSMPHYMVFYINADQQSKYIKDNADQVLADVSRTGQNRISSDITNTSVWQLGRIAADYAESSGIPLDGIKTVASNIGNTVSETATNGEGVAKFAAQTAQATVGSFTKTTKRLKQAIVLPIPQKLATKYGIDWGSADMGAWAGLLDSASLTQTQEAMQEIPSIIGAALGRKAIQAVAKPFNVNERIADVVTRTAVNPRKEQLFNSPEFRTFDFSWTLVPRNAKEAKIIRDIVYAFKFHQHPEMSTGNFFYIYPSEFDIKFYFDGNENPWINKISTCALKSVSVNYTPNNEFVSYEDGATDSIELSLSFVELELLTKERIEKGY